MSTRKRTGNGKVGRPPRTPDATDGVDVRITAEWRTWMREARARKNLTQRELAALVGCSCALIARIETADIAQSHFVDVIAKELGIPLPFVEVPAPSIVHEQAHQYVTAILEHASAKQVREVVKYLSTAALAARKNA